MVLRDIMKYIESEFTVITNTHCHICGGEYLAQELEVEIIDGIPYDVCDCVCSNCGYEKSFEFFAPFIDDKYFTKLKSKLN